MEKVKKNLDFTEGKVFLKIVLFILPIIATNLLQVLYNADPAAVGGTLPGEDFYWAAQ